MAAFYNGILGQEVMYMIPEGFDLSKEYGVVLEGGGAKGAYQIGVWKAFMEYGIKIKAVAGVSVGALNGALICMGDYEKAVSLWENISYSQIMKVDDGQMEKLMNRRFKELNLQAVRQQSKKILISGGIDATPLKEMIDENVDEQKIKESDIEFIMGTFNVSNMKELEITAKEAEEGYLKDYLLASANFPLFKNEKLLGKTFLDGGITNNVPIDMLIRRGYKDIIVIRIFGVGLEKRVKIPEDVNVIYIAPKINLCNVLEFNKKKAVRNISLGYYDALRILRPLTGIDYYIDSSRNEQDYLESLLNLKENQVKELLSLYKQDVNFDGSGLRKLIEEIYPQLANMLKLRKSWSYTDLYYAVIENCAKKLRIPKYRIYSEQEFCLLLNKRIEQKYQEGEKPDILLNLALSVVSNILT
jgi:NTE family protein